MKRWARVAVALLTGCSGGEVEPIASPPPDPCVALRAELEAVHTRDPCRADSDCELAPGILPPGVVAGAASDPNAGRYGLGGIDRSGSPCGTAIHHEGRAALDAILVRFAAEGCGPVSRDGSTACVSTSHGAHAMCRDGVCALAM